MSWQGEGCKWDERPQSFKPRHWSSFTPLTARPPNSTLNSRLTAVHLIIGRRKKKWFFFKLSCMERLCTTVLIVQPANNWKINLSTNLQSTRKTAMLYVCISAQFKSSTNWLHTKHGFCLLHYNLEWNDLYCFHESHASILSMVYSFS